MRGGGGADARLQLGRVGDGGQGEDEALELVMVVVVAFLLVVGAAGIEVVLGGRTQAQQHVGGDGALGGDHGLDGGAQMLRHLGADAGEGGLVHAVGLVQDDHVGGQDLLLEQLLQRAFVV